MALSNLLGWNKKAETPTGSMRKRLWSIRQIGEKRHGRAPYFYINIEIKNKLRTELYKIL